MIPAPAALLASPADGTQLADCPKTERRSFLSDAMSVAALSVVVRTAGAVKTVAGAWYFRPGAELDAFLLAFLVPSFLGDILAGAIGMALVPALTNGSAEERAALYAEALHRTFRLLSSLAAIAAAVAFLVPETLAPRWRAARPLLLIMLPLLPVMGIAAVWRSVLHTRLHFRAAAFAPILTPVLTIAFLPLAPRIGAMALALGTTLGMLAEAIFLGNALSREGIPLMPRRPVNSRWTLGGAIGQYAALVAGNVMMRGSAVVDQAAAAMLGVGGLSTLSYGTRLSAVLLAIGPASIGTTLVPRFSASIISGQRAKLRQTVIFALGAGCALAAVIVVILTASSEPLTRLFLLRGAFTDSDVHQVALVQTFSLLQLPFAVALAILSGVIAALKINHSTLPIWGMALALHCALDFYFFKPLGVRGIALSTTVVQAFLVVALAAMGVRSMRKSD